MAKSALSRFVRRRRHDLAYLLVLIIRALATVLPRRPGLVLFGAIGGLVYAVGGVERRRTLKHLEYVYGDQWDRWRIRRTARRVFVELGKNLFDAIRIPRLGAKAYARVVSHDPMDEMHAVIAGGSGLIGITGHIGCFEMQLPFFATHGVPAFAIGQRLFDSRVDRIVAGARADGDTIYLRRSENPRTMIRLLREGRSLGVLIDQDTKVEGVFANFLGHLAYTPSGPVRLAMRMKIPVFVTTTARLKGDRHHIYVSKRVQFADTGDFERDLVANVQKVNDLLSEAIHRNPEQWVWMHRRWRRRPDDPAMRDIPRP
jgi:KDO2-lipid IV(A) lauroyltransferase